MRILFLNETSLMSGGERCLLDLLVELDDEVEALVACPPGPLADAVQALGVRVLPMAPMTGSLRLHPWHTPRTLAALVVAAARVRRMDRVHGIDLVHANSLRAGLVAAGARVGGGPRFVAFLHDAIDGRRLARLTSRVIRAEASMVFANSAYSASCFGLDRSDPRLRIVYNPIDLASFDMALHNEAASRAQLGLAPDDLVLAIIAQITPWKGHQEALETLDALRVAHPRARLLLAGEPKFVARATRYDNRRYEAVLRRYVEDRRLERNVVWLGERDDVPAILAAVDILLVPSWAEPFGRVVVEAMAMGCLVVATAVGGPAEVIADGVDGLLLAPGEPLLWARELARIVSDCESMRAMRASAPAAAARFGRAPFARAMLDGYRVALADRR
jgi:glycosyltransferase involved in cell wall biosynthesis